MAKLKVVTYPDPVLLKPADPVNRIGKEDARLIEEMIETMYAEGGVGIAAPQVGVSKQIFIASPKAEKGEELVFINFKLIRSWGEDSQVEGCLSLPGIQAEIRRAAHVEFEARDASGKNVHSTANDFLAKIIQHELDHLNGKLIIDRVDFDQRQALLSEYRS